MESRNPVFSRSEEFTRGGYATFDARSSDRPAGSAPAWGGPATPSAGELQDMYAAPPATPTDMRRMTLDDVVMRTAAMFGVLLLTAGFTYLVWKPLNPIPVIGAAVIGLVLGLVISFSKTIRPALILAYAAVEGVFVGGISSWYDAIYGGGIVAQAVLGTMSAFGAMLVLYKTGVVRNSPKFQRTLMIALVGYMAFAVVHLLGVMFGAWASVYQSGSLLAVALSAFGVVLASLFLVLDFDFVEQGIRNGLPERFAWLAAFGLVVTLVWLYLEMLRLLAILRGDD